ncbi:MAG: hypothetical protein HY289_05470 [Planctomycetes bacterium]|nr:hypothetical protein [Planctomycetota bacterium]
MNTWKRRTGLLLAVGFALLPLCGGSASAPKAAAKNDYWIGKVVPLGELLKKDNIKLDADVNPLVLQTDDGKLYPLLKDDGSRMFFKDAKLLNRPMRLTARKIPNSEILQVINVKSIVKGKVHDVYYYCDVCAIKRFEGGPCDCCGAPLDFKEEPWKEP